MVTWFAGLFYLPRLFVYHAECTDEPGHTRFCVMERRLFVLMTVGAVLTAVSGFWLAFAYGEAFWRQSGWLHAKLAAVAVLFAYHAWCGRLVQTFAARRNRRSPKWFRWFNEIPGLLLLAIVALAVVKPF